MGFSHEAAGRMLVARKRAMSKIVVNTPNGTIGRKVCEALLDAGATLTVISRGADKVAPLAARGATVVEGSIDDAATLKAAFAGADSLLWITPPGGARPDYHAWATSTGEQAAALAREAGIANVVVLSSVGAHSGRGTGPVGVLLEIEDAFRAAIPHVTVLRPGFFMENFFRDVGTLAQMGKIFSPIPADKKVPLVATDDIAAAAVRALLDPRPGHAILGLHGPEDLTYPEVAALLTEAWGRPVEYVQVRVEDARQGMLGAGFPAFAADLFAEMYQAIVDGRMDPAEPRTAETTTPTSLASFFRGTLVPALAGASA